MHRDSETSLDPTPNRMFSSGEGRWLSPDPLHGRISNPQSLNRYSYVQNGPCAATDPLGLLLVDEGCVPYFDEEGNVQTACTGSFLGLGPAVPGGGGGGGGGSPNIWKPWTRTFPCTKSAKQLEAAVQHDFAKYADYSGPVFDAIFSPGPITQGETVNIDAQINLPGGLAVGQTLHVNVSSVTSTSFTFTTVQGQHVFYPGTITFSATDAGNGQVTFTVTPNAYFAGIGYQAMGRLIQQAENDTWTNLLNNLQKLCQQAASK